MDYHGGKRAAPRGCHIGSHKMTSYGMAPVSRRRFLKDAATAAAAAPLLASRTWAETGRKVRHASIGASGMAFSDVRSFAKHPAFELVAVAEVDLCRVTQLQQMFPSVRIYQDWRELLRRERRDLDSVNVSTPDHMHAPIAMEAIRLGKHVYVQKPLTATVSEARILAEFARQQGVVTQMGIQVSSSVPQRVGEAVVRSGVIGRITEAHTFSNKNWGDEGELPNGADPVPPTLDWSLWLGVSAVRPYLHGKYHPGEWRRRVDFGTGTLGDMGCHIFSPPYRALELTSPAAITSYGPAPSRDSWAVRARVHYVFPGTRFTAADTVDVWWYDGGELPPAHLVEMVGDQMPDQGTIFAGTEGIIVLPHGNRPPLILPAEKFKDYQLPVVEERDHYAEFLDAVLAGGSVPPSANFDYSGPLTEAVLLGNAAAWYPGERLTFDARSLRFTGRPEADAHLSRDYRRGWRVRGLT
jgi:predicted dehydrogenase